MLFFFSSRRRHTRLQGDWSSDVCSSDLHLRRVEIEVGLLRVGDAIEPEIGLAPILDRIGVAGLEGERLQIGRASCKGKSVDLGGRRIIKKKKKKRLYMT